MFTGRDEATIMKQKKQRDAEEYQRILKQQIEEKQRRIQTQEKIKLRGSLQTKILSQETKTNVNSNNTSEIGHDHSPGVASSRYSNSNTA